MGFYLLSAPTNQIGTGPAVVQGWAIGSGLIANSNIRITQLGAFVDAGNTWIITKQIRVYQDNGTLLASCDIAASDLGVTASMVGQVVYKPITPITITAGTNFRIQVDTWCETEPFWYNFNSNVGTEDLGGGLVSFVPADVNAGSWLNGSSPTDMVNAPGANANQCHAYFGPSMYYESASTPQATSITLSGPISGMVLYPSTNFTVGANGAISGSITVTPSVSGGGSFNPTNVSITSGSPSGSFTYTPTSTGIKIISVTNDRGLTNPANLSYTSVGQTLATAITLSGPISGVVLYQSTNFTVGANGAISGSITVTPSSNGGGSFNPTAVSLTSGSPTLTFTYTPATTGIKTISVSNNRGLTNPATLSYTSAPSSSISMGSISILANDATGITIGWSAAVGGIGTKTYSLYRNSRSPYTPPVSGTLVGSTTGTSLKDVNPPLDTSIFYRVIVTDSASQTAISTQTSDKVSQEALSTTSIVLGFIGDSITAGVGASQESTKYSSVMCSILSYIYPNRTFTKDNQGLSGTTTTDWASTVSSGLFRNSINSFHSNNVNDVFILLGTNDSKSATPQTANTYKTNMTIIAQTLVSEGFRVFIAGSAYLIPNNSGEWSEYSSSQLLLDYRSTHSTFLSTGKIMEDGNRLYEALMLNQSGLPDGCHPNDLGNSIIAYHRVGGYLTSISKGHPIGKELYSLSSNFLYA